MSALAYYLGLRYIPDSRVVDELLGVPTHLLHAIVDVSQRPVGCTQLGPPVEWVIAQL